MNDNQPIEKLPLTSFSLHILAMAFMLCDHIWATIVSGNMWLTFIGRLAFPIFAFLLVEGYFHTGNLKLYKRRLLIAALISEIPFNLMYGGEIIYPFHQNVMWTLLLCLTGIEIIERSKAAGKLWLFLLTSVGVILLSYLLSIIAILDCGGFGVLTVYMFYFLRGREPYKRVLQLAFMYVINAVIFKGMYYDVTIFGKTFEIMQQSVAVLALIPVWLYNGRQGLHGRAVKYCFYGFYPVHMLVLSLTSLFLL